ncbi:MAG: hypothetical protein RSD27_03425, partial [Ruthenibacterium sp.]
DEFWVKRRMHGVFKHALGGTLAKLLSNPSRGDSMRRASANAQSQGQAPLLLYRLYRPARIKSMPESKKSYKTAKKPSPPPFAFFDQNRYNQKDRQGTIHGKIFCRRLL